VWYGDTSSYKEVKEMAEEVCRLIVEVTYGDAYRGRNSYDFLYPDGMALDGAETDALMVSVADAYVDCLHEDFHCTSCTLYRMEYDPIELKWKRDSFAVAQLEDGREGLRVRTGNNAPAGMGIYLREKAHPPMRGRPGRLILKLGLTELDFGTANVYGSRWNLTSNGAGSIAEIYGDYWPSIGDPAGIGLAPYIALTGTPIPTLPTLVSLAALKDGSHGFDLVSGYTLRWVDKYRQPTPIQG